MSLNILTTNIAKHFPKEFATQMLHKVYTTGLLWVHCQLDLIKVAWNSSHFLKQVLQKWDIDVQIWKGGKLLKLVQLWEWGY